MDTSPQQPGDSAPVAIIDIGSNTIKGLLAARRADGEIVALAREAAEVRISAGSWQGKRLLSETGMSAALDGVSGILAKFGVGEGTPLRLVATSAVRDAANGPEFRERVRALVGRELEIISGEREALLICRGMLCDPGLRNRQSFDLFDLGGGSLEVIRFRQGRLLTAVSLPLGCVRLMERFHPNSSEPLPAEAEAGIAAEVAARCESAGLVFDLGEDGISIGTGGTFTTLRGILAGEAGKDIHHAPQRIALEDIDRLANRLGAMTLDERRTVPRLPPGRADVFPTALATVAAVARRAGASVFRHSFYNLRFGLAAEMLEGS